MEWERIWNIEPILFDDALIELADESIKEVAGTSHRLPSGPLHDAAEVARAGIPTVMVFVQSAPRPLAHQARGHEGGTSRAGRAGARPPCGQDDRSRRSPLEDPHERDTRADEDHSGDATGADLFLLEADPPEMVDRERRECLSRDDHRDQGGAPSLGAAKIDPAT